MKLRQSQGILRFYENFIKNDKIVIFWKNPWLSRSFKLLKIAKKRQKTAKNRVFYHVFGHFGTFFRYFGYWSGPGFLKFLLENSDILLNLLNLVNFWPIEKGGFDRTSKKPDFWKYPFFCQKKYPGSLQSRILEAKKGV